MFDVSLLFKIGAMGVLLMVIEKILKDNGKGEIAVLANFTYTLFDVTNDIFPVSI